MDCEQMGVQHKYLQRREVEGGGGGGWRGRWEDMYVPLELSRGLVVSDMPWTADKVCVCVCASTHECGEEVENW